MKLSSIQLKNFKRFTDLTIENIPATAKLVLLIGSNGSGKSSVFDGFEVINKLAKGEGIGTEILNNYYKKDKNENTIIITTDDCDNVVKINNGNINITPKKQGFTGFSKANFYGRTSFRQVPQLTRISLGQSRFDIENDSDRPRLFIEKDSRFENDVEKITGIILKEFYRTENSKEKILEKYVQPINEALQNIFGKQNGTRLQLLEIIPPLDGNVAQINFSKGNSEVHYNNLSAGEKEVFNILVNLLSRRDLYQDTIYFFDEIDLHLNTKIQYNLMKEITDNWIPDSCQLWTASHSIGFIDFANESDNAVIIDFDDLDFDRPQVLSPIAKDKMEVFEIAVNKEFISRFVQDKKIIFSENTDTPFYNNLNLENTQFFNAIDKQDTFFKSINLNALALIDRDYISDE